MSSLMPQGDDEFDRGPATPPAQPRGMEYDRDLARAEQDRASSNGPLSLAYWLVRGVQGVYGLIRGR